MVALENTHRVHNMVVCTLCSCYPWSVLGLPPVWYKSAPYRSRAVIDPRGVLADFGVTLAADVEVRVWDSTAEIRYLVSRSGRRAPKAGARSNWRRWSRATAMIGTGLPQSRRPRAGHERRARHGRRADFGPVVPEADEPLFHAPGSGAPSR